MSAAKSGNHIVVTGTGNTLASITSDIADTTFIEKTSTSPDIYTIKGNVARYLYVNATGVLTIGNPADYSVNETLVFDQSGAANNNRLYVNAGGHLKQYGDTKIDFSTHATNTSYYSYIYGALTIDGNDTYKPVWQNYNRIYFYEQQNNNTYTSDIWTINKMIFGSSYAANLYAIYIAALGKVRAHSFTNITWDKSYGRGYAMYPIYIPVGFNGAENMTFSGLDFYDCGNYPIQMNNASSIQYIGCTFETTTAQKVYVIGTNFPDTSQTLGSYGYVTAESYAQNFVFLNGCTFGVEAATTGILASQGGVILCKDCDWEQTAGTAITAQYQARVLMWSGNTFSGNREVYAVNYDGAVQWVHALDLTIQDAEGNPIEDCKVGIVQSAGKESFLFRTNASGKLINHFGINKALLTWKHQYGATKATDYEYWSDATNSTYHTVRIFKIGYRPVEYTFVMSDERTQTITLDRIDAHSNTF